VDSSAWVALIAGEEPLGARVANFLATNPAPLATTNLIVAETISRLMKYPGGRLSLPARRQLALDFWRRLIAETVTVVFVDPKLHEAGWREIQRYKDKDFDLFDACSFAVIRKRAIQWVLACDEHFEQMQRAYRFTCVPGIRAAPD